MDIGRDILDVFFVKGNFTVWLIASKDLEAKVVPVFDIESRFQECFEDRIKFGFSKF